MTLYGYVSETCGLKVCDRCVCHFSLMKLLEVLKS